MAAVNDTISRAGLHDMGSEATHVLPRRIIAAMATVEQLGLLARMRRAPLRQRRGSKAGRYYRGRLVAPHVLNFEELQQPTTCSPSKASAVAEVRYEQVRPAKQ